MEYKTFRQRPQFEINNACFLGPLFRNTAMTNGNVCNCDAECSKFGGGPSGTTPLRFSFDRIESHPKSECSLTLNVPVLVSAQRRLLL